MSQAGSQTNVSLHPVASRHGAQTSTVVSVTVTPSNVPANTDHRGQDPFGTPRLERLATTQPSSPSTSRSNSTTNSVETEWGIHHETLDTYPLLDNSTPFVSYDQGRDDNQTLFDSRKQGPFRPEFQYESNPIRAMTAEQLARLHSQYVSLDVPHSQVFPFLHGVDGSNPAQNAFFGAPLSGQSTPRYRGLTIVRADMPTPDELQRISAQQQAPILTSSHSWNQDHQATTNSRARALSSATSKSSTLSSVGHADSEQDFQPEHIQSPPMNVVGCGAHVQDDDPSRTMTSSASSASMASSAGPSLFSIYSGGRSTGSRTSISSLSDTNDDALKSQTKSERSRLSTPSSYEPQPSHSILNSTIHPAEILNPPSTRPSRSSYDDEVTSGSDQEQANVERIGATFYVPRQTMGISLRNFRIQTAKYATISDIVLYCPTGYHEGMLNLARCFREAQETLWKERCERGWGGLRYNVFVVTDSFEIFERDYPHLIAVDSFGYSRNRVDFIERERQEMERLTKASMIDDNVWLGCTADAPVAPTGDSSDNEPITPNEGGNPYHFGVCIEAHEKGSVPSESKLAYASHFLNTADMLESCKDFSQVDESIIHDLSAFDAHPNPCDERESTLVLGPQGWTPRQCWSTTLQNGQANTHPDGEQSEACGYNSMSASTEPENVFRLECTSTSQLYVSDEQKDLLAKQIVRLCGWIKEQASPSILHEETATSASFSNALRSLGSGKRTSAFFSSQYHQNKRDRGSSQRACGQRRTARRVLIHCSDGYTETSILALAYLMYSRKLSLPEAYLDLQLRANRSFFVYPADQQFLQKVEQLIVQERNVSRQQPVSAQAKEGNGPLDRSRHASSKSCGNFESLEERLSLKTGLTNRSGHSRRVSAHVSSDGGSSGQSESSYWARSLAAATGLVSVAQPSLKRPTTTEAKMGGSLFGRSRTPTPRTAASSPTEQSKPCQPSTLDRHAWFEDYPFDGSFPSRILPFLYLGNLNHAENVDMLRALGITHLVSVGEVAIRPDDRQTYDTITYMNLSKVKNEMSKSRSEDALTQRSRVQSPSTSLPCIKYTSGNIDVLYLSNVSDDGIDSLRGTMREAVEYIEAARRTGGKVLVHCRVGVSRSTTIVLAYVMAHLDLSLVESYLLVRSRRLNILIQPHLLFLWELRGWETYLAKAKENQAKLLTSMDLAEYPHHESGRYLAKDSIRSLSVTPIRRGSDSFKSSRSSPAITPMLGSFKDETDKSGQDGLHEKVIDVDIGAGAGSVYGFEVPDAAFLPFGCGSLGGLPAASTRLLWGHFTREISDLNSRYFI